MKKIEAIIRPGKTNSVMVALREMGYPGITISEVEGHGKQKGITLQWRGREYTKELLPKIKLELVVRNEDAEKIFVAIVKAAQTGGIGDGKIFVYDVVDAVRIRTGERGDDAV
ncbi:MAG: P-II family nitrogen regulator, partial [Atribacterota bacterium]